MEKEEGFFSSFFKWAKGTNNSSLPAVPTQSTSRLVLPFDIANRIQPKQNFLEKSLIVGKGILTSPTFLNLCASLFTVYFTYWLFIKNLPKKKENEGTDIINHILKYRTSIKNLELNSHERRIAADIILPNDESMKFEDIGGMDGIKKQVYNDLLIPIRRADRYKGKLTAIPKGILLHGPPGTGKTSIAKAIATEGDYVFINLKISDIFSKWMGESEKVVSAAFSLARKLKPSIIFIDELDSLFRKRNGNEHALYATVKSCFMSEWDGMLSERNSVILIGATNRPEDLDEAIARRLERKIYVGLPTEEERETILRVILKSEEVDSDFDYQLIAAQTKNWSGATLRTLCEFVARENAARDLEEEEVKAMTTEDFINSIHHFAPKVSSNSSNFTSNGNQNQAAINQALSEALFKEIISQAINQGRGGSN